MTPIPTIAYILLIPVALALSLGLHWLMEAFTRAWYTKPKPPKPRHPRF